MQERTFAASPAFLLAPGAIMETFIKIPKFTSGQRLAMFQGIRDLAAKRGLTSIVELAERGFAHDHMTCALDSCWVEGSRGRLYKPEVTALSRRVQPVLLSIRDIPLAHTRGLPDIDPLHAQVKEMLSDLYPGGLGALVTQTYVDRVAGVELVLEKLQTRYAALIETLSMNKQVVRLAELASAYRTAVNNGHTLRFCEVREMHAQGQKRLRALIALILGTFYDDDNADHEIAREELLEPVAHMKRLARMTRRRRRRGAGTADEGAGAADEGAVTVDEGAVTADERAAMADERAAMADEGAVTADEGAVTADEGAAMTDEGAAMADEESVDVTARPHAPGLVTSGRGSG
jgi:hypothetical protein